MYASFYAHMRAGDLPIFALLLFLCLFMVVVVRMMWLKRREDFDPLAHLPLVDDARGEAAPPARPHEVKGSDR